MVRIPVPRGLAKFAIDHIPGVNSLTGIPSGAIDYLIHPALYSTVNADRDSEGSGIHAPNFSVYAHRLSLSLQKHAEIGSAPMG